MSAKADHAAPPADRAPGVHGVLHFGRAIDSQGAPAANGVAPDVHPVGPIVTLIDTPAQFDFARVHVWLATESHWARGIERATVERAFANSLAVGAFADGVQVGVARAVTDDATFAYLCDVFVDRAWRGRGVARRMVLHLLHHPRLTGLRRVVLRSRDARGLYARLGFGALPEPEIWMERPAVPPRTA